MLDLKSDLLTESAWQSVLRQYKQRSAMERIATGSVDTFHATMGGFGLKQVRPPQSSLYDNCFIITGDMELLFVPQSNNSNKIDFHKVYSIDNSYKEYIDKVEYFWGLWDRKKKGGVIYKHVWTPYPPQLNLVPYKISIPGGNDYIINDLKELRNFKTQRDLE